MEALSNVDRFVVLLRQKLAERATAKAASTKRAAATDRAAPAAPHRPLAELAAGAGADDRTLRRTIIEQLLADRLGAEFANEPRFQQIVERVTKLIAEDAELGALLAEVLGQVRSRS